MGMNLKLLFTALILVPLFACTSPAGKGKVDSEIYLEIAKEYFAAGNIEKALQEADNAIKADNDNYHAHFFKAEALAGEGRFEEAFRVVDDGAKKLKPGKRYLKDHWLGVLYLHKKDMEKAVTYLQDSRQQNPNFTGNYNLLGKVYSQLGNMEETEKIYNKWTEIEPGSDTAWDNLGITYVRIGKLGKAEKALEKARAINPDSSNIYNNLGTLAQKLEQWDRADRYFLKSLDIAPGHPTANLNHGQHLMVMGKHNEAFPFLEKAMKLRPDDIFALFWVARYYHETAEYQKSIEHYKRALKINPSFAPARIAMGKSYLKSGENYPEGLKVMEEGLRVDPGNRSNYYYHLALLKQAQKDLKAALDYAEKSLVPVDNRNINNTAARHFLRGNLFNDMGQQAKAELDYRKVMQIVPGTAIAKEAQEYIKD